MAVSSPRRASVLHAILSPALLLAACATGVLEAQRVVVKDKSGGQALTVFLDGPTKDSVKVPAGSYALRIVNRVPSKSYSVQVSLEAIEIPPISNVRSQEVSDASPCLLLAKATESLRTAKDERGVALAISALKPLNEAPPNTACVKEKEAARALIDSTEYLHKLGTSTAIYMLSPGTLLRVIVTRAGEPGGPDARWERVFTPGPAGEWRATFGYAAVVTNGWSNSDWLPPISGYSTRDLGSGKFQIMADRRPKAFDLAPLVLFSFHRAALAGASSQWGWTAGLGPDLTSPTLFLGYGLTYWSNLHLSLGLTLRQEPRLLGRYQAGDTVTTTLTTEQLTGNVWQPRPFLGVSFRFAESIFKRTPNETPAVSAAPPQSPED